MTGDLSNLIQRKVTLGFIFMAGCAGMGVILYATRWGAAISDDTYDYIHAARDLLAGRGFTLTPHFPPGLSLVLGAIGLFGPDPLVSVRWLNAIIFGVAIILAGAILLAMTGSAFFALVGSLIFLSADVLIETHSWAMSEPLFICFMLSGFLALALSKRDERWVGTCLAGLLFGLAAVTRYIGAALPLALALAWLLRASLPFNQRLRRAVLSGLTGLAPVAMYMLRNETLIGRPTSRVLAWHPMDLGGWRAAWSTVLIWFIPGRFVHGKEWVWLMGFSFLGLAGAVIWWLRRKPSESSSTWSEPASKRSEPWGQTSSEQVASGHAVVAPVLALGILCYLGVLFVSRTFFDTAIPMDDRLLSPVLVMLLLLLLAGLARLWTARVIGSKAAVGLIILAIFAVNLTRSVDTVRSYHTVGRGYASARDAISETYAYLRKKPDIPIYSNAFAAIYFWTGRDTYSIPSTAGLAEMKADMRRNGAYLVVFDSIPVELYHVTQAELIDGLVVQIHLSEATIYRSP